MAADNSATAAPLSVTTSKTKLQRESRSRSQLSRGAWKVRWPQLASDSRNHAKKRIAPLRLIVAGSSSCSGPPWPPCRHPFVNQASSSALAGLAESNSFIGLSRCREAKRTSKVSDGARRRTSRAVHWANVVLEICVPEPSVRILSWKQFVTRWPCLLKPTSFTPRKPQSPLESCPWSPVDAP